MMKKAIILLLLAAGCESVNVGTALPVPGPVKPTLGVSVGKSGIKGSAGVAGKVGKVPVAVSGTSKPVKLSSDENNEQPKNNKKGTSQ